MNIAFDAKRAYQNGTGLGHYSRTLIASLARQFFQHRYFLCAPKLTARFDHTAFPNVADITPTGALAKQFPALWRGNWVKDDLLKHRVDLYHGLSHEIPTGIQKTGIRSVVTIHDLIFERYPQQYNWIDVKIYHQKFTYACHHADHIIAISEQTKRDIVDLYKTPAEKITVCYQSCNPAFAKTLTLAEKQRVRQLYNLPKRYFLYVGSIIERKNLLNICKAVALLKGKLDIPLVVAGDGDKYKQQVKQYLAANGVQHQVIFLSDRQIAKDSAAYQSAADFPAIYQNAVALIYPSFFEGFGIPVLEALYSGVPVITSNVSCLPETGGNAAYYVDPHSPQEIAAGMEKIAGDEIFANQMRDKGWLHAQKFSPEKGAADVMDVYLRLL